MTFSTANKVNKYGVVEGEPLSPLSFVLTGDSLQKMLEKEREQGNLGGLGASGNTTLSLISNLWLFGECIIGHAIPLKFIPYCFKVRSKINFH